MKRVTLPLGVSLDLADGWGDITDDLEAGTPFTLARENGVGAFQFSSALFAGGAVPNAKKEDLCEMLDSFGRTRHLGAPTEVRFYDEKARCVGGSFHRDDFVRAWYVTDGRSFLFASHVAARRAPDEVAACELMIRSVEFCKDE